MADQIPGLEQLCHAIRTHDDALAAQHTKQFVSQNWPLIVAIERLADAEYAAGKYDAARRKFELIESLVPHATGFFLRRVSAGLRAGDPHVLGELGASAGRLTNDNELYHAIEELAGNGRPDLATALIAACNGRDGFSPGMLAVARSRIMSATGRYSDAINLLKSAFDAPKPHILVLRLCYLAMEQLLDFGGAQQVCERAALLWGEERDLRHAIERLTYVFQFGAAATLLRMFTDRHPGQAALAAQLQREVDGAKAAADRAIIACGPIHTATPTEIYAALSKPGTPADRVLWGKQALVALLYSDRLSVNDYSAFAWFLPNWEEGLIRNHVLAAAWVRFPAAPEVQAGYLHHLITQNVYADAAKFCRVLLQGDASEDSLFYVIGLLRLEKDRMVPSFMDGGLFEMLRSDLLRRVASTGAAFRCVMHDHIVALGGAPESWPEDALPPSAAAEAPAFRRLFAVTTGRLGRVSTQPAAARTAPIRPVVAISGQLRGFESTWETLDAHLCRPTGAPVIVSVWDRSINATGRHARRLERTLPDDVIGRLKPEERYTDAFEQAYPETFKLLFGQTTVDAASVRALVDASRRPVIEVETESEQAIARLLPPHISSNMLKMYYKFARLETLIEDAEARSGELFSHVIWSRPDCHIERLAPADLLGCLAHPEVAWSSFVTENSFGDYVMVLPRRAFSAIASIFPRVVTAGDTRLMPWRPNRSSDPRKRSALDAFGGPDVLFDVLLAAGYLPLGRIPRMALRLVGRTPGAEIVRRVFDAEQQLAQTG